MNYFRFISNDKENSMIKKERTDILVNKILQLDN